MSKKISLALLSLAVLHTSSSFSSEIKKKGLSLGLETQTYYSLQEKEMGANFSHLFASYSTQGNGSLLDVFEEKSFKNLGVTFDIEISSLPFILDAHPREVLQEKADHLVESKVAYAMKYNPAFQGLGDAQLAGIEANLIAQGKAKAYKMIDEKVDSIQLEKAFQRASLSFCITQQNCLSLGKESQFSTSQDDYDSGVFVTPNISKRVGGVGGTGFIAYRYDTEVDTQGPFEGVKVVFKANIFKSRLSYEGMPSHIARTVNLNDDDFNRADDFHDLDSGAIFLSLSKNNTITSVYVSKHYKSDKPELTLNLNTKSDNGKHELDLTYYYNASKCGNGLRCSLDSSVTAEFTEHFTKKFSAGVRVYGAMGSQNHYTSTREKEDYFGVSVSSKYTLLEGKYKEVSYLAETKIEGSYNNSDFLNENFDLYGGLNLNVKY